MLKIFMGFNKGVLTMAKPWQAWLGLLVAVNLVPPFFFLGTLEAKVVLVGFVVSIAIMLTLFAKFGYVRLLGLGHAPWLFTVPWLWSRLGEVTSTGPLYYWLLGVVILDGISLLIDAVDVVRYARGDRKASVTVESV